MGSPLSEKGADRGFSLLLLLITEDFSFTRVHGHDTFLVIGEPYPEFVGMDLRLMLMISPMVLQQSPQRWHTMFMVRYPFFAG